MTVRLVAARDARDIAWANASQLVGRPAHTTDEDLRISMLRLAASRLCPVTRDLLVGATVTSLRGLTSGDAATAEEIDGDVDRLIAYGDLLIGRDVSAERPRNLIYLAPPMFVRRSAGAVFVVGAIPEMPSPFADVTRARGSVRELVPAPTDQELVDAGYTPFPMDSWMESPAARTPKDLLSELNTRLDLTGNSGQLLELEIVDPRADVSFYRGRWSTPKRQTGRFLARRKRKWGGRAWGFADLVDGQPVRFLAFPSIDRRFRGCDEAWWAMCASDALAGTPQSIEVEATDGRTTLGFRVPLPMWAERRLLAVGTVAETRPRGTLAAYGIRSEDATEEIAFLGERLWMQPVGQ